MDLINVMGLRFGEAGHQKISIPQFGLNIGFYFGRSLHQFTELFGEQKKVSKP